MLYLRCFWTGPTPEFFIKFLFFSSGEGVLCLLNFERFYFVHLSIHPTSAHRYQSKQDIKMAEKRQQIDLMQLPLPHLNQLKESLEQEVDVLQNSLQQLKLAQGKFLDSLESLNKFKPESEGKDILVPLTSSLYVPGKLSDVKTVLIDIGTGYYIEKSVEQAKEYFKRKVDFMTKNMEKVQPGMAEKYKLKQAVMEVMNIKYQAQLAQMQQQTQAVKS